MKLPPIVRDALFDFMARFNPRGFGRWLLDRAGYKTLLRERWLHAPNGIVPALAHRKSRILAELEQKYPAFPREELDWRAFELTVAEAAEEMTVAGIERSLMVLPLFPKWTP